MQAQEHERIRKLNWDKLRTNLASAAVGNSGLGGGNNRSGKIAMAALNTFAKAAEKGMPHCSTPPPRAPVKLMTCPLLTVLSAE